MSVTATSKRRSRTFSFLKGDIDLNFLDKHGIHLSHHDTTFTDHTLPISKATTVAELLENAAQTESSIIFYPSRSSSEVRVSYYELLRRARLRAQVIRSIKRIKPESIVLLHFKEQRDNIEWFWATTIAGHIPAMSTPLVHDPNQRQRHLNHLQVMLEKPIVLTKESLTEDLAGVLDMDIHTIEALDKAVDNALPFAGPTPRQPTDLAALMLTSGSTGHAKAVKLTNAQILQAVNGKAKFNNLKAKDVFMSWIGLDHVANLTEIFLLAVSLGADQVQVQPSDVTTHPLKFLQLVQEHRVSYTFAPNFFLAKLLRALPETNIRYDLSCLRKLISGGEANVVNTGAILTNRLLHCGVPHNFISPAFGMTETCAGCIYSTTFPTSDLSKQLEFASLGHTTPTTEMRVVREDNAKLPSNQVGELQIRGTNIFQGYYNHPMATADAFTQDGWFKTGDRAYIDSDGCLNLAGRTKETIIINGLNYYPQEIESAIDEEMIMGIVPSYTAVFGYRAPKSDTEGYVVVYAAAYGQDDAKSRFKTQENITKVAAMLTNVKPTHIIPLPISLLSKSSLGKLPRLKIKAAFASGAYNDIDKENDRLLKSYQLGLREAPSNMVESLVMRECADLFGLRLDSFGVQSTIFELGATSIDLFSLKTRLESKLSIADIPMSVLLMNPTMKAVASKISNLKGLNSTYDPVVSISTSGSKTPLWLVHPGSGDVLVFLALAKYFPERPVYGLRARGFNNGEKCFDTIEEAAVTYYESIKRCQAEGPYAIGGYSLGSTLAFEVAKLLEANGDEVAFTGVFDSPPHIAELISRTDWVTVALNVAYFLGLVAQTRPAGLDKSLDGISQEQVIERIMSWAPKERITELKLDHAGLLHVVSITNAFRLAALKYRCEGSVSNMDIFFVDPLHAVCTGRRDWLDNYLKGWAPFCRSNIRYHECLGDHARMFNEEFAFELQKKIKAVFRDRGI